VSALQEYCAHRYLPYLESHAYSSKYKQLLACGSVMVAPRIDYPDFFLRALQPGIHYVLLNASDLCEDTVSAFPTLRSRVREPISAVPRVASWISAVPRVAS